METRAHYVLIGAFVLSAAAAAFLFILWIGSGQREFDEYDVIFTERVSGLSEGSIVRFNGIQKGEVATLSIDPDDPSIVVARVRVDKNTPIKTDTSAELEFVGFTGLAIIQFVGGSKEAPMLKTVSEFDVPRLQADTSGFTMFLESSGDVLAQANLLLSDKNINAIAGIIENIETATSAFADNKDDIETLLKNAGAISQDLASITQKLESAATALDEIVAGDGAKTVREAEALMAESRALIADLNSIVNDNRASIEIFAERGLGQVAPTLTEARRLMRTLDYMLREIDRDPPAYFFGERLPEFEGEGGK